MTAMPIRDMEILSTFLGKVGLDNELEWMKESRIVVLPTKLEDTE